MPLPPQGQVEVKFGFIDKSCSISRPPKNKLPLNDFSYRPLFATLSVNNILTVFGYLLGEARIAICSKNYSLLTPVTEAFLSLIFPFVWQGAYIPVMPSSMTDILDAPVPFLVGLHSRYLKMNPQDQRPRGVIFVDLDNDIVHLGFDDDTPHKRVTPRLPEREAGKLKSKLDEYGRLAYLPSDKHVPGTIMTGNGEILPNHMREEYAKGEAEDSTQASNKSSRREHGGRSSGEEGGGRKKRHGSLGTVRRIGDARDATLGKSDLAFPNNEHLLPIDTFATEQGMVLKKGKQREGLSSEGIRSGYGDEGRNGLAEKLNFSILDTANNEQGNMFSAKEIRGAFLRFFVSIFRHYDKHVNGADSGKPFNRDNFMKESSHLNSECHEWMNGCLGTQMFERFIEERITNSMQPEIQFFNESIIQKLNR